LLPFLALALLLPAQPCAELVTDFNDGVPDWAAEAPAWITPAPDWGDRVVFEERDGSLNMRLTGPVSGIVHWKRDTSITEGTSAEVRLDVVQSAGFAFGMVGLMGSPAPQIEVGYYLLITPWWVAPVEYRLDYSRSAYGEVDNNPQWTFLTPWYRNLLYSNVTFGMEVTGVGDAVRITVSVWDRSPERRLMFRQSVLDPVNPSGGDLGQPFRSFSHVFVGMHRLPSTQFPDTMAVDNLHYTYGPADPFVAVKAAVGRSINAHDVGGVASHFTDHAVLDFVPLPEPMVTPAGVEQFFTALFQGWPDYQTISEHLMIGDGLLVTEHSVVASHLGEWLGIPVTGTTGVRSSHADIWEFAGDKVSRLTTYMDLQSLLVAVGAMPPPELPPLVPSFTLPDPVPRAFAPLTIIRADQAEWNAHDLIGHARQLRADARLMVAPLARVLDRKAWMALQELYFKAFPDLKLQAVRTFVLEDSWVASEVVFRGTQDGPYFGASPSGLSIEVRGLILYRLDEEGLTRNMNVYWDNLTMHKQMGLVPLTRAEMVALHQRHQGAIAAHDVPQLLSYLTEDAVYDFVPLPRPLSTRTEIGAFFEGLFTAFPDYETLSENLLLGDRVIVTEHKTAGTLSAEWLGIPATGRSFPTVHLDIWELGGTQLRKVTTYFDTQYVLVASGLMPPPDLPPLVPSFPLPAPVGSGLDALATVVEAQAAYNRHDLVQMARRMSADARILLGALGPEPLDRASYIALQELYNLAFSDLEMAVDRQWLLDDGWVLSEVRLMGLNDGPYFGLPATWKRFEVRSAILHHVSPEGLITQMNAYWDALTGHTQLGLFPPPLPEADLLALNDGVGAAIQAHDADAVAGFFAEDGVSTNLGSGARNVGWDEIRQNFAGWFHVFPDYRTVSEERWIAGAIVVTEHAAQGTFENDWGSLTATGKLGPPLKHLDIWEYRGNQIALKQTYMDLHTFLAAAGVMPAPVVPSQPPSFALPAPAGSGLGAAATVLEAIALENAGDLAGLARRMKADLQVWRAPFDTTVSRATDIAIRESLRQGMPDLQWRIQRVLEFRGGWVLAELLMKGTHTRPYLGIQPLGRSVEVPAGCMYRIDEAGLIADLRIHTDNYSLLRQIGALLPPMPREELLAAYAKIHEAIQARDADRLVADVGEFYRYHYGPLPAPMDQAQTRDFFAALFTAFPDFSTDDGLVLAAKNLVVVEHVATATHQGAYDLGAFGVLPPTGRSTAMPHIDVFEFAGGKNVRAATYFNFQSQLIQLGVLPLPGELPPLEPSFTLPPPEPAARTPLETLAQLTAAWNAHDLAAVAKLTAVDADFYNAALGKKLTRAEYVALQELFFAAFPDLTVRPWKTVDLGDGWVVVEASFPGTHLGPFLGIPATGRRGTVAGVVLYRFNEQGLQTYQHTYYDNITVLAQLGVFDPLLIKAERQGERVSLSWPLVPSQGMVLETTVSLTNPTWTAVPTQPVVEGDRLKLTVEPSGASAYFRLHRAGP